MNLSPEDARKIADSNLANIRKKVDAGKTLSARELRFIQDASGHSISGTDGAFASTKAELADRCGVSRRTITNHFRDPGAPKARADGRHDVVAWQTFLRDRGIVDAGEEDQDVDQVNHKEEFYRLKCEELRIRLQAELRELVPVGEVLAAAGRSVTAFRTSLNQLAGRCAQSIIGLKDYDEIKEVIESEIAVILRVLQEASFLDVPPDEVIGEVDEEDAQVVEEGTQLENPGIIVLQKSRNSRSSKTAQASKRKRDKKSALSHSRRRRRK